MLRTSMPRGTRDLLIAIGVLLVAACVRGQAGWDENAVGSLEKLNEDDVGEFLRRGAGNHMDNWAVLVCTSRFWFNYRHVANTLALYRCASQRTSRPLRCAASSRGAWRRPTLT